MFDFDENFSPPVKIKVVGVGGGGVNAVNYMISKNFTGLNFVAVDTDEKSLAISQAPLKIIIDDRKPQEIQNEIIKSLAGSDMVFIVAGMGGNSGTKLASIIGNYSRGLGALTVAVVTYPLTIENLKEKANDGLKKLSRCVDSFTVISNDKAKTFGTADKFLSLAIRSITDLINIPGIINLDMADIKTILKDSGLMFLGVGEAFGENACINAAKVAVDSLSLETRIQSAHRFLINITASSENLTLNEVNEASMLIQEAAYEDAEIMWGMSVDESFGNTVRVICFTTDFYSQN